MSWFIGNNSLLISATGNTGGPCTLDWTNVGSSYWNCYKNSIATTIASSLSNDGESTISGASGGSASAFRGGVLLPDGRVFFVAYSERSRIYNPSTNTITLANTGTYITPGCFVGGVLLNDGRVFMIPYNATSSRIYNPANDTVSTPAGSYPGTGAFHGGVKMSDGRVFCVPLNSTTGRIYDPITNTTSTPSVAFPGNLAFSGGVLLPNGKIFLVPYALSTARVYDPSTDTLSTPTGDAFPVSGTTQMYMSGVLLPDGRVFCPPSTTGSNAATYGRIYDPITDSISTAGGTYQGGSGMYLGGVLLPNGKVFVIPVIGTNTGRLYDPVTNSVSILSFTSINTSSRAFYGGVAMLDGRVCCIPYASSSTKIFGVTGKGTFDSNVILSAYYNKL